MCSSGRELLGPPVVAKEEYRLWLQRSAILQSERVERLTGMGMALSSSDYQEPGGQSSRGHRVPTPAPCRQTRLPPQGGARRRGGSASSCCGCSLESS